VVRAGTCKSELHNKPAGCGAAKANVSGTGSEGEEEEAAQNSVRILSDYFDTQRSTNIPELTQ